MLPGIRCAFGAILTLAAISASAVAAEPQAVRVRFSLANDASPVTITVSGKVTDARTGQPIAGALVRGVVSIGKHRGPERFAKMPYQETRSDDHGAYVLRFVTPLTMSGPGRDSDGLCVDAGAKDYETRPQYVRPHVSPDKTAFTMDFALKPGKLVRGRVVDEEGKSVEGALVRVQNSWNGDWNYFNSLGCASTDADGGFQVWCSTDVDQVISADPWLRIVKEGYGTGFFWDLLKKEDLGTLTIRRGGTITGRVVDSQGKAAAGCEVSVYDLWPNRIATAKTDEQGRYELKGVPGERVLAEFYQRKNARVIPELLKMTVYARSNPASSLTEVPRYTITAKDGAAVTGPDLVVGREVSISGKLLPSKDAFGLKGIPVRLDFDWGTMVETDAEGNFRFPNVSPGKHHLTAYLPTNLRGDRGIGRAEVEVKPGQSVAGVQIQLETLTEVRVQFVDANGDGVEGITAAATATKNGEGFWTEGTRSDKDGWAVLYLDSWGVQYVRGFDMAGERYVSEGYREVRPLFAALTKVIDNVKIVMVPPASIRGKVTGEGLSSSDSKGRLLCRLDYADGVSLTRPIKVHTAGQFDLGGLSPGVVKVSLATQPRGSQAALSEPIELKPGQVKELPAMTLSKLAMHRVSGRLVASPTFSKLDGFKIRLDLMEWEPMIATDAQGQFVLPNAAPGKHRLTAYLPFNLRTDRGVGHVDIEVKDGDLNGVQLQLETLAVVPIRIVDPSGRPLEGISAAAWWTENHSGVFTEGAKSDKDGRATLYLYPDQRQYVGAHDWSGKYRLSGHKALQVKRGQTTEELTVIMTPAEKGQ